MISVKLYCHCDRHRAKDNFEEDLPEKIRKSLRRALPKSLFAEIVVINILSSTWDLKEDVGYAEIHSSSDAHPEHVLKVANVVLREIDVVMVYFPDGTIKSFKHGESASKSS